VRITALPAKQKIRPEDTERILEMILRILPLWKKIHSAGTLYLTSDSAMHLGGNSSHLAGKDAPCLGGKFGKHLRILIADLLKRKVETLIGHRLVVLPEVNPTLDGLGLRHNKK
jgi:hypothetical protein|tara:strand:- start:2002 stop:2343 length:342 start_codon:yes stop_codon:yes gene_type:complete